MASNPRPVPPEVAKNDNAGAEVSGCPELSMIFYPDGAADNPTHLCSSDFAVPAYFDRIYRKAYNAFTAGQFQECQTHCDFLTRDGRCPKFPRLKAEILKAFCFIEPNSANWLYESARESVTNLQKSYGPDSAEAKGILAEFELSLQSLHAFLGQSSASMPARGTVEPRALQVEPAPAQIAQDSQAQNLMQTAAVEEPSLAGRHQGGCHHGGVGGVTADPLDTIDGNSPDRGHRLVSE